MGNGLVFIIDHNAFAKSKLRATIEELRVEKSVAIYWANFPTDG